MKRIQAKHAVILEVRAARKVAVKFGYTGFALVINWPAEKRMTFYVEHHFGQTFGFLEKFVRLKPSDRRQRVKGIRFCNCNHVVRLRIYPKFTLIKILHDKRIAQFCDVDRPVNIIGKEIAILERDSIARTGNVAARERRLVHFGIEIIEQISAQFRPALVVFAIGGL